MPHILWRGINRTSLERCVLESVANGHRLSATTLAVVDGVAVEIRTSVITDAAWNPTTVGVHAQGAGDDRTLALTGDGAGSWSVGDAPLVDLYGAVDVHLGWSPAGHTLTLRRLDLDIGESASVTALRIGFPERDVVREVHAYERLAPRRYRFSSGDYTVDLTVDEEQFVTAYPGRWTAEDRPST